MFSGLLRDVALGVGNTVRCGAIAADVLELEGGVGDGEGLPDRLLHVLADFFGFPEAGLTADDHVGRQRAIPLERLHT